MLTGDRDPSSIINSPSRNYDDCPKIDAERELTPYGAASVATFARRCLAGRTAGGVGLLDAENFGIGTSGIIDRVESTADGGIIGLNVLTPTFVETMRLARQLRRAYPDTRLVFGGPHATLDPTSILEHVDSGIVVVGDGETPFTRIAQGDPLDNINGLVIRRGDDFTRTGNRLPHIEMDLNALPWIDRMLLCNEPFKKGKDRVMTFLGSRGCVGSCSFCITPAQYELTKVTGVGKMRFRDMADVVKEIAANADSLDVAQFIDDDMLPSVSRVREFLRLWEEYGLSGNKEFVCLLRPDQISKYGERGLLDDLYHAGLTKISLGIETGHDRGRRMLSAGARDIDKKYDALTQMDAIRACDHVGIETKGFFMIGLPGETREEIQQTLAYARRLKEMGLSRAAIFPVKVYPNTQLWNVAISQGFTPEDLGHYDAPNIKAMIDSGSSAKDASRDGFTQTAQLSELSNEELNQLCQEAMQELNSK